MEKKRSKGLTILGGFFLFCVIPALMFAFIGLISGPTQPKDALGRALDDFTRFGFLLGPFIFLIEGIGILKLKNWIRIFTIIFNLINILFVTVSFFYFNILLKVPFDSFNESINVFIGVFSIYIIYYLTRPDVKKQFE